jgi:PIN domain nuclease of toxin-antitoxin system
LSLLVDTNIVIWWLDDNPRLPPAVAGRISSGAEIVVISPVVAWEIEIKRALGKLKAPTDLEAQVAASHFVALPVTLRHAIIAGRLPLHHKDPFDRLLIAQAQCEQLTLVTADASLAVYGVQLLLA